MALSTDEVRHVAMLARLALTDDEIDHLAPQLSDILAYADKVGEVAAEDVAPTTHPYPLRNVTRPDEPRPSLDRDLLLAGAPAVEDDRFAVPRIVADGGASPEARSEASTHGAIDQPPPHMSPGYGGVSGEHARRTRSEEG